jgi:shikimate dehydrogenase
MQVYGLLGNPVEHSLSPPMHEAAYDALGMDARYCTFEPAPEELGAAIEGARALGIGGLNVTIPFKRDVLDHVRPDGLAGRIGAVNTVDLAGEPTGHNTDAEGAVRALREHGVGFSGRAVVVGAGGAGRAVAFGLGEEGMAVHVANRTVERATELAEELRAAGVDATGGPLEADAVGERIADASVLVNATSVGMEEDASPVRADTLHGDLAVLDAVYTPLETRLLREAEAAGARTIDGAWMLLYQGAAALERWTGREAPVAAMNDALRERV